MNSIFPEIGFHCPCQETGKSFNLLKLIDPTVWQGSCSPEMPGEIADCQIHTAGCVPPLWAVQVYHMSVQQFGVDWRRSSRKTGKAVWVAACRLSRAASRGHSSLQRSGFPLWRFLLLRSTGSGACGLSMQHVGSVAVGHGLSRSTSGIFPDQYQTHVPCTGRWILVDCTTREVQERS